MASKEFYTTGEAAKLLNISQSTVSRMFNRNILLGKQNPITGKRLISRESIAVIGKQYLHEVDGFAVNKKRILLGTPDEGLLGDVKKRDVPQISFPR
jgi:DNA-binding transcriptional MerR regulator